MSRRHLIRMSGPEIRVFLFQQRTVILATNGRDGWPHLMPLWYVVRDRGPDDEPELWSWTYAASQKVKNLERDSRCTLQVETGVDYGELRGLMSTAECVVHTELELVAGIGADLAVRYGGAERDDAVMAAMRAQAPKRVGLQFVTRRTVTWDHRKLAGTY